MLPDHLVDGAEAEFGHPLAEVLGEEAEEALDVLGRPPKRARSSGSWVATPTGQVLRWHLRIMMQPSADEDDRAETELLGAQQGGDRQVAPGAQLAVDLDADAVAQPVGDQRLLRLGQAELPGQAGSA